MVLSSKNNGLMIICLMCLCIDVYRKEVLVRMICSICLTCNKSHQGLLAGSLLDATIWLVICKPSKVTSVVTVWWVQISGRYNFLGFRCYDSILLSRFNTPPPPPPNKPTSSPPKQKYICTCYPWKFIVGILLYKHAMKNSQLIWEKLLAIAIRLQNVKIVACQGIMKNNNYNSSQFVTLYTNSLCYNYKEERKQQWNDEAARKDEEMWDFQDAGHINRIL